MYTTGAVFTVLFLQSVHGYSNSLNIDFSTYSSSQTVTSFLNANSLYTSDYTVQSTPLAHAFTPDNVNIADGFLQLKVSGGASGTVPSAEVGTTFSNIKFVSCAP